MEGQEDKPLTPGESMSAAMKADAEADAILNDAFADITGGGQPKVQQPPQPPQPPQPQDQPPKEGDQPREPVIPSSEATTREQLTSLFGDQPSDTQPLQQQDVQIPQDQDVPDPKDMDEKAQNSWAFLKHQKAELRRVAEQQRAQIEQFRANEAKFAEERRQLTEALAAKDAELQEKSDKLGQFNLSGQTEFRKRYDEPLKQAEADLDALIHENIDVNTPEEIAAARGKILSDDATFRNYISGLQDAELEGRFLAARQRYMNVNAARDAALKDWQTTQNGLAAASAQENAAEESLRRTKLADAAIRFNTQALPADRRAYVLTDPYYAADVETASAAFKDFMQTATPEQVARSAFMGHLMPAMNRALVHALSTAQQYQRAYYAIKGLAKPGSFAARPGGDAAPARPRQPVAQQPLSEVEKLDAEATEIASQFLPPR